MIGGPSCLVHGRCRATTRLTHSPRYEKKDVDDVRKGAEIDPKSVSDTDPGNYSSPFIELNQFITNNPSNAVLLYQI